MGNKVVDVHIVALEKDSKGKVKSYGKGDVIRKSLVVSDETLKEFNDLSYQTCQRYYIDESKTKNLK